MFFSTQICVDKCHPLHSMWLLSCYLEDARARKKRIPDRTLKRADLVKILKELTKMFVVDGRRRGFALAMNTDMFNAVVYTLEFKAIDLLSESRKLLVNINKKNPFGATENQCEDLLTINLDTNLAAAKTTTVLQTFPDADALKMRFNQITMADYDVENPSLAQNIHQDDFGHTTFDDIEALERTSQLEEGRREPNVLGEFEDPSFLPGILEAELQDPGFLPANISPGQQFNDLVDFLEQAPQDMAAQDQDTDRLFQSHQVVNDTTGAVTLGNEDGFGDDLTATRRDDDSTVTGRDEEAPRQTRPLPNIVIERPSNEGQDGVHGVELTPPPANDVAPAMDVDEEFGPALHTVVNDDIYEQGAPIVDEVEEHRDVAAFDGPQAPGVEINIIPETQEDEEDIELPAPTPANTPATKKTTRRKKRKLIVDQVTSLSRSEIQAQLVFLDCEETVRSRAKKAQPPRSSDQLLRTPMTQFHPQSELSELWKFTHRSLITKRPREPSSSSSSSEDDESRYRRDRELSSLREGLQVDLSSIPNVSGILRDVGESQSNLDDLPGFLQDQQDPDIQQDMDLGASELRNATEVTAGQADIGSPGLSSVRKERSKDASFTMDSDMGVSELRGTSDITGINADMPPPPPLDDFQDDQVVNDASALLQVNQEPPVLDVTPQDDQEMLQVEPVLDNEVPLEDEPHAEGVVDPYANVDLLSLNIAAPNTSAGELLDKMRDVAGADNSLFFSSVCAAESTDKLLAGVTFFNMLKLQRSAYVVCQQDQLQDDIHIRLQHKDGSEYGSSSEYATAGSSCA